MNMKKSTFTILSLSFLLSSATTNTMNRSLILNKKIQAKNAFDEAIPVKVIRAIILGYYCSSDKKMLARMPAGERKEIKSIQCIKKKDSFFMIILFPEESQNLPHCMTIGNCTQLQHGKKYEAKSQWPYMENSIEIEIIRSPSPQQQKVKKALKN